MIAVPTTPRAISLFDPMLLCGVLNVTVAKQNIGPPAMTVTRQLGRIRRWRFPMRVQIGIGIE